MSLIKSEITAEEYSNASPSEQAFYKQKTEGQGGNYFFTGAKPPESDGQRGEQDRRDYEAVAKARDDALRQLSDLKAQQENEKHQAEIDSASKQKIDDYWKEKVSKLEKQHGEQVGQLEASIVQTHLKSVITDLASKLAIDDSVEAVKSILRERITAKMGEGLQPKVIIRDERGQESPMTTDEFAKAFSKDNRYKRLLKGNEKMGGGTKSDQPVEVPRAVNHANNILQRQPGEQGGPQHTDSFLQSGYGADSSQLVKFLNARINNRKMGR